MAGGMQAGGQSYLLPPVMGMWTHADTRPGAFSCGRGVVGRVLCGIPRTPESPPFSRLPGGQPLPSSSFYLGVSVMLWCTSVHVYTHTHRQTHSHNHEYADTCAHTNADPHAHTCMQTPVHTQACAHTHACVQADVRSSRGHGLFNTQAHLLSESKWRAGLRRRNIFFPEIAERFPLRK